MPVQDRGAQGRSPGQRSGVRTMRSRRKVVFDRLAEPAACSVTRRLVSMTTSSPGPLPAPASSPATKTNEEEQLGDAGHARDLTDQHLCSVSDAPTARAAAALAAPGSPAGSGSGRTIGRSGYCMYSGLVRFAWLGLTRCCHTPRSRAGIAIATAGLSGGLLYHAVSCRATRRRVTRQHSDSAALRQAWRQPEPSHLNAGPGPGTRPTPTPPARDRRAGSAGRRRSAARRRGRWR